MQILVCIKQIPDTREVRINSQTGDLVRDGVPSIINPEDKNAVEEAVRLKEKHGGRVIVLSMGPPQAEDALREALAMGADKAFLLADRAFAGADTSATSYTLGLAVNKLGGFDLILCGREALDGNTGQVGPQLAELLDLPQVTYVRKVEASERSIKVEKAVEDGYQIIETGLPALLTLVKEINQPRIPSMEQIVDSYQEKEVVIWGAGDLGADAGSFGHRNSPSMIKESSVVTFKGRDLKLIQGNSTEIAWELTRELAKYHLI